MTPFKDPNKKKDYQRELMRKRRGTTIRICTQCHTAYQGKKCPTCFGGKGGIVNYGN